jgi:hypothetical protein
MTPRAPRRVARLLAAAVALWLAAGLLAGSARAQAPPPTAPAGAAGTWTAVIDAPSGRVELAFRLAHDGERVFGTYDYRGPVLVALNVRVTGVLRGNTLTLFEQGGAESVLEARVEGRSMTGTFRGSSHPGPITAVRAD